MKKVRVAELFAGVGGFRLGLKESIYDFVWSNQWEPATKTQHASDIYIARFGEKNHSNENIYSVPTSKIPEHDLLVGGFPCQDYSVAKSLKQSEGINGKKGVLWWEIHRILKEKKQNKPSYLLLENVDRLLISPANQRGRDFAIILASLSDLGYAVEWRVINAADYGFPQRRKRTFMLGYHKDSDIYKEIKKDCLSSWCFDKGVLAEAFPVKEKDSFIDEHFKIEGDLEEVSEDFNFKNKNGIVFKNAGIMINREVFTERLFPFFTGKRTVLKDIILSERDVPEEYFIEEKDLAKWKYLKGAKHLLKTSKKTGKTFKYDEGQMSFPDALDKPARTIITAEGGSSPSRFKHVIKTKSGRLRRLTPVELERLDMFPDNHTMGVSDTKRAFMMGNALVVGVISKISEEFVNRIKK